MKNLFLFMLFIMCTSIYVRAQETFPVNDVQDNRAHAYAFTNATIFTNYNTTVEDATLLIRDGKIEAVGTSVNVPSGYTTVDLGGKYIYPSFIDIYTTYGVPEPKIERGGFFRREQIQSDKKGPYNANEAIKSEIDASEIFTVNTKDAKTWRDMGFGSVLSFHKDGLARGTSAFVTLAEDTENEVMLTPQVANHFSFNKGTSNQSYPFSAMGYISLLRQTYMDADWYNSYDNRPFTDLSLEAWLANQSLPQIFEANSWLNILRADKLGDEFGVQYIMRAGVDTYQRIEAVKNTGASLIASVDFPDASDVDDPIDAYKVSL